MRYTIVTTAQLREIFTTMMQQLWSLVWVLVVSQKDVVGFFLVPDARNNDVNQQRVSSNSRLMGLSESSKKPSGFKAFSSSFPNNRPGSKKRGTENFSEDDAIPTNDLSMFLADQEDETSFDPLEFFMTQDESIQKLEEVEEFFRQEPSGIMMEEQFGVVPSAENRKKQYRTKKDSHVAATTNPIASETIRMKHDNFDINFEEDPVSKRVFLYNYDGTLSKIKANLADKPTKHYTE